MAQNNNYQKLADDLLGKVKRLSLDKTISPEMRDFWITYYNLKMLQELNDIIGFDNATYREFATKQVDVLLRIHDNTKKGLNVEDYF